MLSTIVRKSATWPTTSWHRYGVARKKTTVPARLRRPQGDAMLQYRRLTMRLRDAPDTGQLRRVAALIAEAGQREVS